MLNHATETFLWSLFRLGLVVGDSKKALEKVASLYDLCLDIPEKVERLLTEYWSSEDLEKLLSLALTALEDFCLDVEHRTRLTAHLFANGRIDLAQACAFLAFDSVNVDDLEPSVRRVADVLWLLRQDSDARVMEPVDDALLSEALRNLAEAEAAMTD